MSVPVSQKSAPARVLVADDQADVVEAVRLLLKLEGYEVDGVGSPGAVLAALSRGDHDVALIDLNYARRPAGRGSICWPRSAAWTRHCRSW
jgi:DNA-binding NtrC family response regulator